MNSELMNLLEKWRSTTGMPNCMCCSMGNLCNQCKAKLKCADELESTLASQPKVTEQVRDSATLLDLANWCEKAADTRCCKSCDAGWIERAMAIRRTVVLLAPQSVVSADFEQKVLDILDELTPEDADVSHPCHQAYQRIGKLFNDALLAPQGENNRELYDKFNERMEKISLEEFTTEPAPTPQCFC